MKPVPVDKIVEGNKPRIKVIEPYPDSPFAVGDILIEQNMGATKNPYYQIGRFGFPNSPSIYYPEKYPAIFKHLEWWEDRKEDEMPEYVKNIYHLNVYKVRDHFLHGFTADHDGVSRGYEKYLPATESEYNNQNNSKNIKDYLFLYLGCRVILSFQNFKGSKYDEGNWPLNGYLLADYLEDKSIILKPILRPLSDMTEEEDTELCVFCLVSDLEHKQKWDALLMSEAKRTTYLLSKHFDLFGLIDAGLALDKNKIENHG